MDADSSVPPPLALLPPDPQWRLRPVRAGDFDRLRYELWRERSPEQARDLLNRALISAENRRGLGICAQAPDGDMLIAFGMLTVWSRCVEISDLIVLEHWRGHGVGTALIQYFVNHASRMSIHCAEIGVALSNPRALALYRRLGFQDRYQLMLDLGRGREPVLYLRLELPAHPPN